MTVLPRWRTIGHLAGALLLAFFLACGGGSSRVPSGHLEIVNHDPLNMTSLFVTPSDSPTWGVDQLAPAYLRQDDSLTLTHVDPGSYVVQAWFSDGSSDEVFDVQVLDGVTTSVAMQFTGDGNVAMTNNTGTPIVGAYLTPSTVSTWGPNQLDQALNPGYTQTLTGVAPAAYDLRAVFAGGGHADFLNFQVLAGSTVTINVN